MATVEEQNLEPVPSQSNMLEGDQKLITATWMRWFTNLRAKINVINASIVALAGGSTPGFLSSTGTGGINARTFIAGTGISITNPTGVGGNPVISASGGAGGSPMHVTQVTGTSYTVQLADAPDTTANVGWIDSANAAANTVNIDTNANVSLPVGTNLFICQGGSGTTTIKALAGVNFYGSAITPAGHYGVGRAVQIATDIWRIFGDLSFSVYISYQSTVLGDSPIAYWTFDNTLNSLVGTFPWAYQSGTVLTYVAPLITTGNAANFTGSAYYDIAYDAAFGTNTFSIELWIQFTSTSNFVIFEINGNSGFSVQINANTVRLNAGNATSNFINTTVINDGLTHHVVFTATPSLLQVYVDGAFQTSSATGAVGTYSQPLYLGSRAGSYGFIGTIDELAYYNYVLTATQVSNHYAAG